MNDAVADRGGEPVRLDLAEQVERMRLAQRERDKHGVAPARPSRVESADEVRERHIRRLAPRRERWESRLPALYRNAALDLLADEQQPQTLRDWLAGDSLTLFLAGAAGVGKTYAAYALGRAAVDVPMWVEAWNTVELLEALLPGAIAAETLDAVLRCDLLILDDLYAPKVTDWAAQTMYRIADARVNELRRQIITTNGQWASLVERWGEPTMDRLGYQSVGVVVAGEQSRRKRAAFNS